MSEDNTMNSSQLTVCDVYKNLWKGYENELNYFWQRSVFLAAFLLGIAASYSIYVKDILLQNSGEYIKCIGSTISFHEIVIVSMIPLFICILGMCFSYLWIAMMKGSKRWYELYEDSIAKFSNDKGNKTLENFWKDPSFKRIFNEESCPTEYRFGCMDHRKSEESQQPQEDCNIFSTHRGSFSPSRINIAIGIISFIAFFLCTVIHACIGLWYVYAVTSFCWLCAIAIIGVILGIAVAIWLTRLIKSQNNE